ncbi:DNA topoisomerase IB [Tahibacter amnicola]|uniref:DNA topoisomerase IB n=1 Tax=Tahibacter amnicola TaxID=2976241 RepID=A0ABY6BKN3_9GAMM|nr:DNA topoisomerase IB [Tahibacter amnicola]UXI70454.1 DNA topoisomerase IB [Tahibacter amnicola]
MRHSPECDSDLPLDAPLASPAAISHCVDAGLRYVSDTEPGITRHRRGRGFIYRNPDGTRVEDPAELARIRSLAIPPAYRDVWICTRADGHIQATGRDARGRKQYRYHADWRSVRDAAKYDRLIAFGEGLGALRKRVKADLSRRGLPRERVLALVIAVLEHTLIRVGNPEYARTNRSFGLTTLLNRHVRETRSRLTFRFRAKSGVMQEIALSDARLRILVRRCQELPGQSLFQYVDDDGVHRPVSSQDVNAYIRDALGDDFSAKDFRTWAGSVIAGQLLSRADRPESPRAARRHITAAITAVARALGNTPAVCRACYVHPAICEAYERDELLPLRRVPEGAAWQKAERATLRVLRRQARRRRGAR